MKNKHLVLIFLGVLAVGVLARRSPWFKANVFQTDLIQLDTSAVTQISIFEPGQPELLLERTEAGWAAAQEMRSVTAQPAHIAPILTALLSVRSLRIVKTTRPDTLGFSEKNRLQVVVFREKEILDQFEIGYQTYENSQPATFIRLSRHEGIYLVEQHLRNVFAKKIGDFRENTVSRFEPAQVRAFEWERRDSMPVFFQKNDSTGSWEYLSKKQEMPDDSVQIWLNLFSRLNGSPFADHFDESRTRETFFRGMKMHLSDGDSLIFKVFYVKPPDVPEEIAAAKLTGLPLYVLHSSQNPSNFFAPKDTVLLRRIFEPNFRKVERHNDFNDD